MWENNNEFCSDSFLSGSFSFRVMFPRHRQAGPQLVLGGGRQRCLFCLFQARVRAAPGGASWPVPLRHLQRSDSESGERCQRWSQAQAWAKHVRLSVYNSVKLEMTQMPSSQRGEGGRKYFCTYSASPCASVLISLVWMKTMVVGGNWGGLQKEIKNSSSLDSLDKNSRLLGQLWLEWTPKRSCPAAFVSSVVLRNLQIH